MNRRKLLGGFLGLGALAVTRKLPEDTPAVMHVPYASIAPTRARTTPVTHSSMRDGEMWYRSDLDEFRARVNGETVTLRGPVMFEFGFEDA